MLLAGALHAIISQKVAQTSLAIHTHHAAVSAYNNILYKKQQFPFICWWYLPYGHKADVSSLVVLWYGVWHLLMVERIEIYMATYGCLLWPCMAMREKWGDWKEITVA